MFLHGTAALGGFGTLFSSANAEEARKQQKHVILVFMSGGPSQFETWDPKTGRPNGGPHLSIPTLIPGIHFDEYMPGLSKLANKMATIRSMHSPFGQHVEGGLYTQTGQRPSPAVASAPHWGSVVAHELPTTQAGIPSYVMLGKDQGAFPTPGSGWLGASFAALQCPGNGNPPEDLPKSSSEELQALAAREELRASIGQRFAKGRNSLPIRTHEVAFERMGNLIAKSELFDIAKEPTAVREKFGESRLGRDCLLARRLIERGVSFVRVQHQNSGAWDKHRRAFDSQRVITSEFDTVVSALVHDLIERGLWEHTLLVCMGEFGRMPTISTGALGRDHWNKSWSMSMGGCGIKSGVVLGSTNIDGTEIKDRPVTVPELFATFYSALGIDPKKELHYLGRPMPLIENGAKPIAEVLA